MKRTCGNLNHPVHLFLQNVNWFPRSRLVDQATLHIYILIPCPAQPNIKKNIYIYIYISCNKQPLMCVNASHV